ncbi:hypothetical protein CDV36_013947 [Fusarium kuroshium]|uniref:Uncharacterized protein n=1 Tax=Fusarium kuroshium TaxID=2010991 RepID=A0A3M2RM91_9HYPO|nr:hypothetical protein CDV36_013947 [Fusarium kuroshium]
MTRAIPKANTFAERLYTLIQNRRTSSHGCSMAAFKDNTFVYGGSWSEYGSIDLLQVQLTTRNGAYTALEQTAPERMLPPENSKEVLGDKDFITAGPWEGLQGFSIRTFMERNGD